MAYPNGPGIVMNPSVPVCLPVEGGTCVGKMIIVQGTFTNHSPGLTINLQCAYAMEPVPDIALHFTVRFNEHCVVRNSHIGGNWGPEERHGGMPFNATQPFEVIILVENGAYKIAVNGKHFTEFHHRLQKEMASFVRVDGNVRLNFVKFQGGPGGGIPAGAIPGGGFPAGAVPGAGFPGAVGFTVTPQAAPAFPAGAYPPQWGQPRPPPPSYQPAAPIYNPPVPFLTQIPGGVVPGKMIFITGVPFPTASRFTFNIQNGSMENNDIGLHFDVRMNFGDSGAVVVRNHRKGSCWGSEERHQSYFPFNPNAQFDIIVLAEKQGFKVAVNNQHFIEFTHRIHALKRLDTLTVTGDLRLTMIRFQ